MAKWGITESEKRLVLGRISYTQDLKELSKTDLLVEAALDHPQIKQELLHEADQLCRPEVIFISTSATMRISDLAKEIDRSDMLVGLHFIPPVTQVSVAELVRGERTSDEAVETAKTFAARLGKQAVEIEESRGLVNPRALVAMINEAAYMVDEGVCEAQDAELILKESWGMKQGPLEMADRLGLDLILNWMEQLQQVFGPRYAPCPILRRYVRQGRLGVKTRLGFLAYTEDDSVFTEDNGDKED